MGNLTIPKVSSEELCKRYNRIKPIVQFDDEKHFLREFTEGELSGISYLWNASEDKRDAVDMKQYTYDEENDFECLHAYGYHGFFKPSIAEVLAQIPEELLDKVDAFEIIDEPRTAADFGGEHAEAFSAGFHVSVVRLYTKIQ